MKLWSSQLNREGLERGKKEEQSTKTVFGKWVAYPGRKLRRVRNVQHIVWWEAGAVAYSGVMGTREKRDIKIWFRLIGLEWIVTGYGDE